MEISSFVLVRRPIDLERFCRLRTAPSFNVITLVSTPTFTNVCSPQKGLIKGPLEILLSYHSARYKIQGSRRHPMFGFLTVESSRHSVFVYFNVVTNVADSVGLYPSHMLDQTDTIRVKYG